MQRAACPLSPTPCLMGQGTCSPEPTATGAKAGPGPSLFADSHSLFTLTPGSRGLKFSRVIMGLRSVHFSFWKGDEYKVILEIDLNPIWMFYIALSLHTKDTINELERNGIQTLEAPYTYANT